MNTKLRAASICVVESRLLVQRKPGDERWALPGGSLEPGENPREALHRELGEELGPAIEFTIDRFRGCVDNRFVVDGQWRHEIGFYFSTTIPGLPVGVAFEGAEGDQAIRFDWLDQAEWGTMLQPAGIEQLILGEAQYLEVRPNTAS